MFLLTGVITAGVFVLVVVAGICTGHGGKNLSAIAPAVPVDESSPPTSAPTEDWNEAWESYSRSFITNSLTTTRAEEFFNVSVAYNAAARTKKRTVIWFLDHGRELPGTLVGLGILGTFFGLAIGLGNFVTTDVEAIQISVQTLLGGVRTAFWTSIFGIMGSIIVQHAIVNRYMASFEHRTAQYCEYLDRHFFRDPLRLIASKLSAVNDHGELTLAEIASRSYRELEVQSRSLSSFSTDLSDAIKNIADEIIDGQVAPTLELLKEAIEDLKRTKEQSAETVIAGALDSLQSAMGGLVSEFKETVSGEAKAEIEDLARTLREAGASLAGMPEILKTAEESFSETITAQAQLLQEVVDQARKQTEATSTALEAFGKLEAGLENSARNLNGSIGGMQSLISSLSETIDNQQRRSEQILRIGERLDATVERAVKGLSSTSNNMSELDTRLAKVLTTLTSNIDEYRKTVDHSLKQYLETYTREATEFVNRLSGSFESMNESFEEQIDKLQIIYEGLGRLIEQNGPDVGQDTA